MQRAFIIDVRDNVATVLQPVSEGQELILLGESEHTTCRANEAIRAEHKLALTDISKGAAVIKYGIPIGHAIKDIAQGEWVHLHNCASNYDKRSSSLDIESGAPTDIEYV